MRTDTQRGYTLIEILVVVLIISIVSSVALLTISHNSRKELEHFSKVFTRQIRLAEEEAMLQPITLGLALSPTHFQFFEYHPEDEKAPWQPLASPIFNAHPFPAHAVVHLIIQKKQMALDGKPQIIIYESGEMLPFKILLAEKNQSPLLQIVGHANGEVESERIIEK